MPDDIRDRRRQRPPPTAVREAIRAGMTAARPSRAETAQSAPPLLDSAAPLLVEHDELSTPIALAHDVNARSEWRLQQLQANDIELARVIGGILGEQTRTASGLESLVKLADKSDKREERREEAAIESARTREARDAEAKKEGRSSREKILLAILGVVATIATSYAIGSKVAATNADATPAAVRAP